MRITLFDMLINVYLVATCLYIHVLLLSFDSLFSPIATFDVMWLGPYRECFQQVASELQALYPSTSPSPSSSSDPAVHTHVTSSTSQLPGINRCFIPLLMPTKNWTSGECEERYKFTFPPGPISPLFQDLYRFLGQFLGIAIRYVRIFT